MIDFSTERWNRVKENSRRWWAHELDRPLIQIRIWGRDPQRPPARLPGLRRASFYDKTISPADIVDRWDFELSSHEYLGDSFPCVWPDFGPGVAATFAGAVAEPAPDTVWFHPRQSCDITSLKLHCDDTTAELVRVQDICREAMRRWNGTVQVGMTDLGGNLDIVSTFRPNEELLLDLYDHPADVKRATWEAHHLWWHAFDRINSVLQPINPGYTAWCPIFSESPYYMLQCDFAYMISPRMFDDFVKPELEATCRRLTNAFYHLDGVGQLPHLDSLLSIRELKGIQWIPGAGQKPEAEWPDVYRRIRAAGKLVQVYQPAAVDAIAETLGSARGVVLVAGFAPDRRTEADDLLRRHGAL